MTTDKKRVTMKGKLCDLLGIDESAKAEIIYGKVLEALEKQNDNTEKRNFFENESELVKSKVLEKFETLELTKYELLEYAKSLASSPIEDFEVSKALDIISSHHKPLQGQAGVADGRLFAAMEKVRERMDSGEYKPRYRASQVREKELGLIPKSAVIKEADTSLQTFENWLNRNPELRENFT